mmetsp:Transcript_129387/g.182420  ORF Transcript_129387/g.182420 Transcript_129387/m.182420 type:complete len:168 (+) Transcript_129387:21-524(+)
MKIVLILALICGIAFAATTFELALVYEGQCDVSASGYTCSGKAGTETLTTTVSSDGSVTFNDKHPIGATSMWTAIGSINGDNIHETGNITFGIHQTHQDHAVFYSEVGSAFVAPVVGGTECTAQNYNITLGKGTLTGAYGPLAATCCIVSGTGTHPFRCLLAGVVTY